MRHRQTYESIPPALASSAHPSTIDHIEMPHQEAVDAILPINSVRPPSAARLAAEALFSSATTPLDASSIPVVITRRASRIPADKRAAVEPEERRLGLSRSPAVHRLVSAAYEAVDALSQSPDPFVIVAESVPATEDPRAANRLPRKRRRRLHGEVTIIRPSEEGVAAGPESSAVGTAVGRTTPTSGALKAVPKRVRQSAFEMPQHSPKYFALLARIETLQLEAELALKQEAADAICWIKQAIRTYGLTAKDLGLR